MRLQKHAPSFDSALKRVALRAAAPPLCNRCRRHASSQAFPEKVAVLGGGISGLASAYFVAKEFPQSRITVHEANKDGGGWIQSRRIDVPGGDVLFEYGPRTLRPGKDALITAQLVSAHGHRFDIGLISGRSKTCSSQTTSSSPVKTRPPRGTATFTTPTNPNDSPPRRMGWISSNWLSSGSLGYWLAYPAHYSNLFGLNGPLPCAMNP